MMKSANELMFQALLTDPEKRKKVLELLTSEGIVPPSESTAGGSRSNTPTSRHNRLDDLTRTPLMQLLSPKRNNVKKKPLIESPSAQFRRRALQKLESDSSIDSSAEEKLPSPPSGGTPVPFDHLLKGVVAYCEVRSKEGDRSSGIKAVMKAMGATVRDNFSRDLTHIVFKDGLFSTFQKAKLLKIHLVSVLWLEAVRRHKYRVPESKYPALGVEAYDANVTAICQALQKDYDDVVQDEYRRRSEIKHNTSVSSKNNFDTPARKKSYAPESKTSKFENMSDAAHLTGSTSSVNRTRSKTPNRASPMSVVSDNESSMSFLSEKNIDDVVPCSQDGPSSLSHSHNGNRMLLLMTDDESSENINPDKPNIARHVKDSFELEKSLKIRSPESLLGRKLASKSNAIDQNRNSLDEELSMRLHITSDESNINSTGSKSRSSSLNAQTENTSKDISDLNENPKPKRKYVRRMTLGVTAINSSKSLTNLDDSKKTKASTSTSSMMNKSFDSSNNETGNKEGKKEAATADNNKTKKRRTKFGTNITTVASDNIEIQSTIISELTKSKPVIQNENVPTEQEKQSTLNENKNVEKSDSDDQNKEKNVDKQPVVKPRLRKLYKENFDDLSRFNFFDQPAKSDEQDEVEPVKSKRKYHVELPPGFQIPKNLSSKARAASVKKTDAPKNTGAIKKIRQSVKKLVFTSSSSDENHGRNISTGSDEIFEPNIEPAKTRKSPRKTTEETKQVIQKDSTVIAKKVSPQKRTLDGKATSELASDSEDAFKTKGPEKKRRKSITIESSSDNDDQASSNDSDKLNQSCVTPRRSTRLNTSKISYIEELDNNPKTPSSAVRRSARRTKHNPDPTPSKTPNLRKQVLTSKTPKKSGSSSEEIKEKSERRSTLEFVQRPSRKSLERIKLTQKPKHVIKLCSIVCTRLHKGDVQVFQQIVKKLGGFIIEDDVTERTTHLVAGAASRTINMLRAIARGCWIVRQEWLFKSLEAGKWLEEEEFELIEFSPAVQKCRLQKKSFGPLYSLDIFKECGPIHVCRSSNPRCSDLEELLSLCGGNIVKTPRLAKIIVGEYFRYDNIFCVNEKWILDCITHNRKKSVKGYLLEPRSSSCSQ